jgi:hypothetical protein
MISAPPAVQSASQLTRAVFAGLLLRRVRVIGLASSFLLLLSAEICNLCQALIHLRRA